MLGANSEQLKSRVVAVADTSAGGSRTKNGCVARHEVPLR
jgi:hypothetical protein